MTAVVIGASGGIGAALLSGLEATASYSSIVGLSRRSGLDLESEASIASAAKDVARRLAENGLLLRLVIDATGILSVDGAGPERSLREIDPTRMTRAFAINAIGPALLMKYFLPLLPKDGRTVFATLSARVGSIGDNQLGGWFSYRASKAALNQIVRTASIELRRTHPEAICVALHPGTVETNLSRGFARTGLAVQAPAEAAQNILRVIAELKSEDSGGFFDWRGDPLPW